MCTSMQNWNNILVQSSLDARNYRLTYADVISRMTLSVLLCYKLLALGSDKHIHYSCTSLLHVSSTTELEHGGPKCLQALCTLGDWVRRTPRTQNIAQRVPIAQTTWQWQAGIVKLLLRIGSLHWFLGSFLFEPHCSSPCPFRLLQRLLRYSLSPKKSHRMLLYVQCVWVNYNNPPTRVGVIRKYLMQDPNDGK